MMDFACVSSPYLATAEACQVFSTLGLDLDRGCHILQALTICVIFLLSTDELDVTWVAWKHQFFLPDQDGGAVFSPVSGSCVPWKVLQYMQLCLGMYLFFLQRLANISGSLDAMFLSRLHGKGQVFPFAHEIWILNLSSRVQEQWQWISWQLWIAEPVPLRTIDLQSSSPERQMSAGAWSTLAFVDWVSIPPMGGATTTFLSPVVLRTWSASKEDQHACFVQIRKFWISEHG